MKIIIDRFEGDFAVVELEDKKMVNILCCLLPRGVAEGDVICITIDKEETNQRKNRIDHLMDSLFKD